MTFLTTLRHVATKEKTYTSQSMPSLMPLPSITEQATILQFLSRSSPSFKASEISPAPCAPGCDHSQFWV